MGNRSRTRAFPSQVLLIIYLIVFCFPLGLSGETTLEADRLTVTGGKTVAEGNVRLTHSGLELNTDRLELTRNGDLEEITATGKVTVSTEETSIRAEELSGTLAGEGDYSQLYLGNVTGELDSIVFRGEEVQIALSEGKPNKVSISKDAKIKFADDSYLEGEKVSLFESEAGWSFEVTGDSIYKTDSTSLRARVITGIMPDGEKQENDSEGQTAEKFVAEEDVRLTHTGWSLNSNHLELETGGETRKVKATGEVELMAGDFSIKGESLSGKGIDGDSTETLRFKLNGATGESGSVKFSGSEIELVMVNGSPESIKISRDPRLSLNQGPLIRGNKALLERSEKGWNFSVTGGVEFENRTTRLTAEGITGEITTGEDGARITELNSEALSGEIILETGKEERTDLRVKGETASLELSDDSKLTRVKINKGSFSSCEGCRCEGGCAYSISAVRTSLIEGDFVLARSARLKSFGVPVGWSPLYFIALKDVGLPRRPYFPRIGYSSEGGLTFSGALPVFLDKNHFGNVVLDYFSRYQGFGLGLDYYSKGRPVAGLGELYGIYRVFGKNFLKLDGSLKYRSLDWLEATADLNVKQGPLYGTNYDVNEWSLILKGRGGGPGWETLVAREEKEDDDEKKHVVERLPELSLSWQEGYENFLDFGLRSELGYYREKKEDWSLTRSGGKGKLGGNLRLTHSPVDLLNLSVTGQGWINPYYDVEAEEVTTRGWASLEPELTLEGPGTFTVGFTHRVKAGKSLFDFDAVEELDRLGINYSSKSGSISQSLGFHYDFTPDDGFSEVKYSLNLTRDPVNQKFTVNYDISRASLSSITTDTGFELDKLEINLSSGYDFDAGEVSETALGFNYSVRKSKVGVRIKSSPFENWLKEVSGNLDLKFLKTWSLGLKGEYDVRAGKISSLSYSLHNTLQNCLKVGITGDLTGLWFDVELAGL